VFRGGGGVEATWRQPGRGQSKLRCERRLGELLADTVRSPDEGRPKEVSHDATLPDLGVTRSDSSRFQRIAAIPGEEFDAHLERTKAAGEDVTTAGALRLWRELNPAEPKQKDFMEHREFEAITDWLKSRRDEWPEEFRPYFPRFMVNLVGQLEDSLGEDD
jgi:hypothetical protein